jgi:hypothetical protein
MKICLFWWAKIESWRGWTIGREYLTNQVVILIMYLPDGELLIKYFTKSFEGAYSMMLILERVE